jgi:fibronectin-binding autotransporter adhesin
MIDEITLPKKFICYFKLSKMVVLLGSFLSSSIAFANPVLEGAPTGATVQQTATTTYVNQTDSQAIINWQSFNINSNEATHFSQPAGGIALNRIDANQGASKIYGTLTATGKIILINQAGIHFGPGSYVNVGGLIASTSDMSDQNFLAGKYSFDKPSSSSGSIVNQGRIIASHGLVALIGTAIHNDGTIEANYGNVVLASGNKFTVSFSGDNLINFTIDEATSSEGMDQYGNKLKDAVSNVGAIYADGGKIMLAAKVASNVVDNVINMQGIAQAKSVYEKKGEIILDGGEHGNVSVSGIIDASGRTPGQRGGTAKFLGEQIYVKDAHVDVSGDMGGGEILIGGNYQGIGPEHNATITFANSNTHLLADAITYGDGGKIIVWANDATGFFGNISARGGSAGGDGGFVETSGKNYLDVGNATVNTLAPMGVNGTWLLDPTDVTISSAATSGNETLFAGTWTPTGSGGANINNTTLVSNLNSGNIIVTTNSGGSDTGNITISDPISWASTNSLTLTANNNIAINAEISDSLAGTLILNATGNVTQSAAIGGSLSLTKQGAGTATLSQANTYNGTTTITAGILEIGIASGALGSSALVLNGGLLQSSLAASINNNFSVNATSTITGSNNLTLAGNGVINGLLNITNSGNTTFSGTLSGASGITQTAGTATFTGSNGGYSGTLTSQLSAIVVNNATNPLGTGTLSLRGSSLQSLTSTSLGNRLDIFTSGGTPASIIGSQDINFTRTNLSTLLHTAGTLAITNTGTTTINNVLDGAGHLTVNIGTGTLALNAAGNAGFTGSITLTSGTLQVGNATNALGIGTSLVLNGGTLQSSLTASLNNPFTVGGAATIGGSNNLTFSGAGTLNNTLSVTNTGATTFSNVLSGAGGLTLNSSGGTTTLSAVNTYSGATTITAGTLQLDLADAIASSSHLNIGASGTLNLNNNNNAINTLLGSGAITLGSGNLSITQGEDQTFSGAISGTGNITKAGANQLTLSGNNNYSGSTTVSAGILSIGSTTGLGNTTSTTVSDGAALDIAFSSSTLGNTNTINLNGTGISLAGALTFSGTSSALSNPIVLQTNSTIGGAGSGTLSGILSGSGINLTKVGSGTVTLSGVNTYSGATSITGGTLSIGATTGLGSTTSTTVSSGSALDIAFSSGTLGNTNTINLNGTGISLAGALTFSGTSSTLSNAIALQTNSTIGGAGSGTLSGILSGSGINLTKVGSGTVTLSGVNTYSGATSITGGTLSIGATTGLGSTTSTTVSSGSALNIAFSSGTLGNTNTINLNGSGISLAGALTFSGTSSTLSNAIALQTDSTIGGSGSGTLSGIISGSGINLTKVGSGTVTLSGVNTYSGATSINAGTLALSGSGSLASSTALSLANVASAIFNISGVTSSSTIGSLAGTGGNVVLGSKTLIAGGDNSNTSYAGVISGSSGNFTKTGSGTLTLSGANSFTGALVVDQGTISTGTINSTSTAGPLGQGTITLGGASSGTLAFTDNTTSTTQVNRAFTMGAGGGVINVTFSGKTLALPSILSGSGSFTKSGSGGLILSSSSSYSGTTTINAGTLALTASGSLPSTTALILADISGAIFDISGVTSGSTIGSLAGGGTTGGDVVLGTKTLTVGDSTSTTYSGVISGTNGNLTKQGSGTLTLDNANTYTGATTLNAGTLALSGSGSLASSTALSLANVASAIFNISGVTSGSTIGSLAGGGGTGGNVVLGTKTLTVGNSTSTTYSGVISGSGGLTKQGSGTLTFDNANTYTGVTTLNAGTLALSGSGSLASSTALSLANVVGAIFDISGVTSGSTIGSLAGGGTTGGNVVLGTKTLTVGDSTSTTYSGVISGSGGLTKQGSGTLTLDNANTYTGATSVNAGTLALSGSGSLASSTALSLANVASAIFDISGVTSSSTIGSLAGGGTTGGNVVLGTKTLTVGDSTSTTYSGVISGTNGNLTKQGSGTLTLDNANTYTGATSVNAGTLALSGSGSLASSTALSLTNVASAIFDISGVTSGSTIGSLAGGGGTGGNVVLGTKTLTVGDSTSTTYSGVIGGTNGNLTKQGSGTLTLANANTYTGATTINAGTLALTGSGSLASSTALSLANVAGAIFNISGVTSSSTIGSLAGGGGTGGNVVLGSKTLIAGGDNSSTSYAGVISGSSGNFTKTGSGTLTLSGANSFTGALVVDQGTISTGTINTTSAAGPLGQGTITLGGASSGTLAFTDNTATTTTLNRAFTMGAGGGVINVTFSGKTLALPSILSGSGSFTKSGPGGLILSSASSYSGTTTINAGTLALTGSGSLASSTALSLANVAGAIFDISGVTSGSTIGSLAGGGTTGGNVVLGTKTLTVGDSTSTTYSGVISGTNGNLTKQGSGTLTLDNANTYTGATSVNAGTLALSGSGSLASSTALSLANVVGAIFDISGVTSSSTIGSLAGGGTTGGNVVLGTKTLTVGDSTSTTYSGVISGTNGNLTKQGSGTLTLDNANTYTGNTIINSGVLRIANASALGGTGAGTSIGSSGTLELISTLLMAEPLTLNGGTLLGSGNSSVIGSITLTAGSTISTSALSDTLTISGEVDGNAALALQGAGNVVLNSAVGNTVRLASLTSDAGTTTLNQGTVNTTGNQNFNDAVILGAATTLDSSTGNVSLAGTVNGASALTINSAGVSTFGSTVGGVTPLSSITTQSSSTIINASTITTSGSQTYNNPVTLGVDAALSTTNGNITLAENVTGGVNLSLLGGSGNNIFTLGGAVNLNNIVVNGVSGSDTLALQSNSGTQTWSINSTNSGDISSISSVTGLFTFQNIANLTGGNANDAFTLSGGTLSGSLQGGSGVNTLQANNGVNSWNITGPNSGSVTGIGGGFSNIENIIGGNSSNTFIFGSNGSVSGLLNGGSASSNNVINLSAYAASIRLALTSESSGSVLNGQTTITNFNGIGNVIGNQSSTLVVPSGKSNTIMLSEFAGGSVNDPIYFSGFNTLVGTGSTTLISTVPAILYRSQGMLVIGGKIMYFSNIQNFGGLISEATAINASESTAIIQVAVSSFDVQANEAVTIATPIMPTLTTTAVDVNTIVTKQMDLDSQFNDLSVNVGCGG